MNYLKNNILLTVVLFVVFLTFIPSLSNTFINWDDPGLLLNNLLVRSLGLDNILKIFTTPLIKIYTPLTIIFFAVEYHFFQYNPLVYHLNNLLLHLATTGLIYVFITQLGFNKRIAAFSALLFGIHPMHVESVAWVSQRKDVLYAFLYMLSLNYYMLYLRSKKKWHFFTVFILGMLSMFAKPMALSLPLILFLCDFFQG
ncbi:MAG: hypothetical protein ACI9F2_000274, partial [Lysobacterales bacterium]